MIYLSITDVISIFNEFSTINIKNLVVYPGAELPVIEAIKLGAPGCISATANLNTKDISKVIDLCHSGKWNEAEELQKKVKSVRLLFQDYAPIPAQKSLLALQTKNSLWNNLRPPFKPISEDTFTFFLINPYKLNVRATVIPIQGTSPSLIRK